MDPFFAAALISYGAILWLFGALLAGYVGGQKRGQSFLWFLCGLFMSPVLALLALAALPEKKVGRAQIDREEEEKPLHRRDIKW